MTEAIIVAALGLVGTLVGSYLANRKSTALIAYRLEQLEQKVQQAQQSGGAHLRTGGERGADGRAGAGGQPPHRRSGRTRIG